MSLLALGLSGAERRVLPIPVYSPHSSREKRHILYCSHELALIHQIAALYVQKLNRYLIVIYPSFTVAVGKVVVPSRSPRVPVPSGFVTTTTVKGTFVSGGVPSPMSTVQLPKKVAVFGAPDDPLVGLPSIWMYRC